MNPVIILLGILILVLLYVLYNYIFPSAAILLNTVNMNQTNTPVTSFNNPGTNRFAIGLWLYVNNIDKQSYTIVSRNDALGMNLKLDGSNGPTLSFNVNTQNNSNTATGTSQVATVVITDNFPIQKWVCIVVCIDNTYIDGYIDGKLLVSTKLPAIPMSSNTDSAAYPITVGSMDAVMQRFTRWSNAINPQQAYEFYTNGNGTNIMSSKYGAKLSLLKDNALSSQITLF